MRALKRKLFGKKNEEEVRERIDQQAKKLLVKKASNWKKMFITITEMK